MKFMLVLMQCLWILSSTDITESMVSTCACARGKTLLQSFSKLPMGLARRGECFRLAHPNTNVSRWSSLAKGNKIIFGLKQDFLFSPCQYLNDDPDAVNGGSCSKIISRREWGARQPKSRKNLPTPAKYIVVHHSFTPQCFSKRSCMQRMRSIQNHHMNEKGWHDIAYNFVIGGDGNIYEARGWGTAGAHVKGYNYDSFGICVIGDYKKAAPNAASLHSLRVMLDCMKSRKKVQNDYKLRVHRDLDKTSCPGDKLFNIIKHWPHNKGYRL